MGSHKEKVISEFERDVNRDAYIDLLRAFALICLVIAHTAPPNGLHFYALLMYH